MQANPVDGLEKVEARGGAIEVFTPAEISALLAAAEADFLPCLVIGGLCGLRSSEIERLHWKDVDLESRYIKVGADRSITASRRIVPIEDNAKRWLSLFGTRTGAIWPGHHHMFYRRQVQASEPADVEWKSNGLRHSYASYRLAPVGDAGRVAGDPGNSASVVHRHYKELVSPADATD